MLKYKAIVVCLACTTDTVIVDGTFLQQKSQIIAARANIWRQNQTPASLGQSDK